MRNRAAYRPLRGRGLSRSRDVSLSLEVPIGEEQRIRYSPPVGTRKTPGRNCPERRAEMSKSNFSRREFLEVSAAAAGGSLGARTIFLRPDPQPTKRVAPSDTVRFGMIGVGMEGSGLLGTSITLPGVECAGAADLYDGRHTLAREIVRPDLPVTRRYRDLLDNKDIDAIVAAVPDHWHRQVVIDSVNAGKDIYCEKPMSHTAADGVAMVDAARKTNRIVQIGSQRVSSQVCAKAKEIIASGALGDLMLVEGWMGRNDPC